MAMSKFEGKLQSTDRWPEADKEFRSSHYEILATKLAELASGKVQLKEFDNQIFIGSSEEVGFWVRFDRDGVIEIGEPAA